MGKLKIGLEFDGEYDERVRAELEQIVARLQVWQATVPANDAQYLVAAADDNLTAERVGVNSPTVLVDYGTTGQAKWHANQSAFGAGYMMGGGGDGGEGEPGPPGPSIPGPTGGTGSTGPQGVPGVGIIPCFDGEDGDSWPLPGTIGPTGAKGDTGATGAAGSAGGGSLVLLEQHSASASASLDFTTCLTSTYDEYEIHLISIVPATNVQALLIELSVDGGANWKVTNYNSNAFVANSTGGAATANNTLTTAIQLTNSLYNGTSWSFSGKYTLFNPLSTAVFKAFNGLGTGPYGSPTRAQWWASANYEVAADAINAFRVRMGSGNITSGTARCYGIAKT